jgi:hypothetical protein
MTMRDKVEGFKVSDHVSKKLRTELYRTEKTKKDWLTEKVDALDNLRKVRNEVNERWVTIPASELDDLHATAPKHYNFIYQRILEHCLQQKLEVTFDNLILDIIWFCNYNDMNHIRFQDGELEVLHIEHETGLDYSKFISKVICKMINVTHQYDLKNTQVNKNSITIKFQKVN